MAEKKGKLYRILVQQRRKPDLLSNYVINQILPEYAPFQPGFWRTSESLTYRWVTDNFAKNRREMMAKPLREFHFKYDFIVPYWHGRVDKSEYYVCCACKKTVVEGLRDEDATEGRV